MKRLTLLTVLLVVLGLASGFALEVKPSFTLTGSAQVSWGIDLDTGYTGFWNTADADLSVYLMAADGTDTKKGEGAWYGEITIADVEFYWADEDGAAPVHYFLGTAVPSGDVSAKIVGLGGNLAIGVAVSGSGPDLALDNVAALETGDYDDTIVDDETLTATDIGVDYGTYGTYISYQLIKELLVSVEIVSPYDWGTNVTTRPTWDAYAFALDVTATFAPVTVVAGVNWGFNYATNPLGVTVKVSADTDMIDPWVGFDAAIDTAFDWEVGGGVTVTLVKDTTVALSAVYGDAFDGVADATAAVDAKVVFTEPQAAGLVDNLDFTLTAWVLDIGSAAGMEYEIIADGGYLLGKIYPNFTVTFGADQAANQLLTVVAGVDWTAIPLTTIGAYWHSGNLFTPAYGYIELLAKVAY